MAIQIELILINHEAVDGDELVYEWNELGMEYCKWYS